jgi:hypothetical protein
MITTQERSEDPPTFEKVWAALMETGREMKAMSKEADRRRDEIDRQQAETAREIKEMVRDGKDLDRRIKAVTQQMGGMANSIGSAAEEFFASAMQSKKLFGGQRYDDVCCNVKGRTTAGIPDEFDIVLYNGGAVAIIEVKQKACQADVEMMVTRKLPDFRDIFPQYRDYKIYLGIGSMSYDKWVREKAHELGVGMLCQKGDTLEDDTGNIRAY